MCQNSGSGVLLRMKALLWDFVRRQRWIHRRHTAAFKSKQRGNVKILDLGEMHEWRKQTQAKLEQARNAIWECIYELDSSIKIKELYTALQDPVAMNTVANRHIKALQEEKKHALQTHTPVLLEKEELWPGPHNPPPKVSADGSNVIAAQSYTDAERPSLSNNRSSGVVADGGEVDLGPTMAASPTIFEWRPGTNDKNGKPAQTYTAAIVKFTGIAEGDILHVNWNSEAFRPVHFLAIDRAANKIVISIRGTINMSDLLTDMCGKPVRHEFTPTLSGYVHSGLLQSAQFVVSSVWDKLEQALSQTE
ncbi:hypothetical protein CEUSTIGMA_g2420.t1 [Chlamydomonas eustigma]|uniref:sn-1-specific diacylglycerol lipase n=1 Tax=Chlamydomonas eustigma TaxID=1157962 RepID=A0A250WVV7_9CHLO|nr:hypothetical protein CEUSTIGMA_g2420.t1 [Chlamydomonas eustigma]|eukprot:GAX74974.1 hypothetical protein CEUSTIGMA_g2420.t1 [Chlamydomonas eustigma]